jgi:hypothetical protein
MAEKIVAAGMEVVIGILFIIAEGAKTTQLTGLYGRGPGVPISAVGRLCVVLLGLIVLCAGIWTLLGL